MADYFEEMGWTPLAEGHTPNQLLHLARLLRDFGMFEELGEDTKLPPPTSSEVLDNLPEIEIKKKEIQCTICLKDFEINDKAKRLPCDHHFHVNCIVPWLQKTSTCPMCRYELPTDDEQYEEYKREKKREKERQEEIEQLHNSMFT